MTMQDDLRKSQQTQAPILLRMSKGTTLEKVVCAHAWNLAGQIAVRIAKTDVVTMLDIPLPMGYVVRFAMLNKNTESGYFLFWTAGDTEYAVNEKDPVVEVCLKFATDIRAGLGKKIEAAYRKRLAEFQAAEALLKTTLETGIAAFQEEETTSGAADDPSESRWGRLDLTA